MNSRQDKARAVRYSAADLAFHRTHPRHVSSGDEQRYRKCSNVENSTVPDCDKNIPSLINSFTKGFQHDANGFVLNVEDFEAFIRASDSGDIETIAALPLAKKPRQWQSYMAQMANNSKGADVRGWESMGTGQTFELQGYDAQALTIPPAPKLWSHELAAEVAELYWMALLRDTAFTEFQSDALVAEAVNHLNSLRWFKDRDDYGLTDYEKKRKRGYLINDCDGEEPTTPFSPGSAFRGNVKGDDIGFIISQFLYVGNQQQGTPKTDPSAFKNSDGYIQYGSTVINQRVRIATPKKNYVTTWKQWIDTQNAADLRGLETYDPPVGNSSSKGFRFINTPRDLATYVHYDALHQAYFNACVLMLNMKVPFDPGIPYRDKDAIDKQIGFATFGGPHILTLVSEVASRALKAVRFQKYAVHRRARPEQIGGFIHQYKTDPSIDGVTCIKKLVDNMSADELFKKVFEHNQLQNTTFEDRQADKEAGTWLLPIAFAEGSPMHPSYGSGHATVAGACVTILKAFFDSGFVLPFAFKPGSDGNTLVEDTEFCGMYTVEGELNKLASNIAIGRNWAGVHWYSDQLESLRLGEQVALGILEEQKLTYGENFSMSVPLFDGTTIRI